MTGAMALIKHRQSQGCYRVYARPDGGGYGCVGVSVLISLSLKESIL